MSSILSTPSLTYFCVLVITNSSKGFVILVPNRSSSFINNQLILSGRYFWASIISVHKISLLILHCPIFQLFALHST
ncbi:hypothetical protein BT96DRAFT_331816 [Gymnopus androsaceus JB14]|uniref:Uncharacterized protein n=1 Tax=Gymnopus androsaceus JB14 TaxID=1447944 RepID=A0A6A4H108_9AGAR|nr:hypothetical protein BT96DRAFT_331816 [Gymnopus androsaceus JB14]